MNTTLKIQFTRVAMLGAMLLSLNACSGSSKGNEDPYAKYTEKEIRVTAEKAMRTENYETVTEALNALDRHFPFGKKAETALLYSMYAYFKAGNIDTALAETDRYLRLYPHGKHLDYVYFFRGVVYFNHTGSWLQHKLNIDPALRDLSDAHKALNNLHTLTQLFPKSRYVQPARKLMYRIGRVLAQHEVEVAEYYFQHKAYVASANRAADVVKHYQGTPQVLRALQIMQKSYQTLGQDKAAKDVAAVIGLNQKLGLK